MFEKFLAAHPKFEIVSAPNNQQLESYKDQLPIEILDFWQKFGWGTFADGYLKMINPTLFQDFMEQTYSVYKMPTTVFAVTAFADILIWEKEYIKLINYRTGITINVGSRVAMLFDLALARKDVMEQALDARQFLPALERLGQCAYDECYGYFPALALGGSEKVENLQKVKLREHLSLLSQMVGVIE